MPHIQCAHVMCEDYNLSNYNYMDHNFPSPGSYMLIILNWFSIRTGKVLDRKVYVKASCKRYTMFS